MPTRRGDYLLGDADEHTESTLEGTTNPTFFSNHKRRNPRTMENPKLGLTHEDRKKTYLDHRKIDIKNDYENLKNFRLHPAPDLESMYSLLEFLYVDLEKTVITHADLVYTPDKLPKYLPKMIRYLEIAEKIKSYNGIYNDETSREIISMVFSDLRVPTDADKLKLNDLFLSNAGYILKPKFFLTMKDLYKLPPFPNINRVYQDQ